MLHVYQNNRHFFSHPVVHETPSQFLNLKKYLVHETVVQFLNLSREEKKFFVQEI